MPETLAERAARLAKAAEATGHSSGGPLADRARRLAGDTTTAQPSRTMGAGWQMAAHLKGLERTPAESTHGLNRNRDGASGDFEAVAPAVPGLVAAATQALPGMEAVQAGARSVVRRQPYRDALSDMRRQTDAIPGAVKFGLQTAVAAPFWPLSKNPATMGALFFGAHAALDADPDLSAGQRATNTAKQGAYGWGLGKAGELGYVMARAAGTPSYSAQRLAQKQRIKQTDAVNYGKAEAEGAAFTGPRPDKLDAAFEAPDIKPYVEAVRSTRQFANADDATVLREAYKLLSERQRMMGRRVLTADDFKAGSTLEGREIGLAKQQLAEAADEVMPSFRAANAEHARLEAEAAAAKLGARAGKNIIRNTEPMGKKAETESAEALRKAMKAMSPEERHAAEQAMLGKLKKDLGLSFNPLKGFGIGKNLARANRLAPYLRPTEDKSALLQFLNGLSKKPGPPAVAPKRDVLALPAPAEAPPGSLPDPDPFAAVRPFSRWLPEKPLAPKLADEVFGKQPPEMQQHIEQDAVLSWLFHRGPFGASGRGGEARPLGRKGMIDFNRSAPDPLAGTKVVDEAGQPKRVYHGTSAAYKDFDPQKLDDSALFGPGYYWTEDPMAAGGDGAGRMGYTGKGAGARPNVRPARLAIKKPFDIDAALPDDDSVRRLMEAAGLPQHYVFGDRSRPIPPSAYLSAESLYEELTRVLGGKAPANRFLREHGYDGITHIGGARTGNKPHRVWIAFDREQIRSPWGNDRTQYGKAPLKVVGSLAGAGAAGLAADAVARRHKKQQP